MISWDPYISTLASDITLDILMYMCAPFKCVWALCVCVLCACFHFILFLPISECNLKVESTC